MAYRAAHCGNEWLTSFAVNPGYVFPRLVDTSESELTI